MDDEQTRRRKELRDEDTESGNTPSIPASIVARVSDSTNEDTVGETSYVIQREEILEVSEVDLGDKSINVDDTAVATVTSPVEVSAHSEESTQSSNESFSNTTEGTPVSLRTLQLYLFQRTYLTD